MLYCENCKFLSEDDAIEVCPYCQYKPLRPPADSDFRFFIEADAGLAEYFQSMLDEEEIPCVLVPSGTGVTTAYGLRLEHFRIHVPHGQYERVYELYQTYFVEDKNAILEEIKANLDKLHIPHPKLEKKWRKKCKLPPDANLLDYIRDLILACDTLGDGGKISGCVNGGNYYFLRQGDDTCVTINSATYAVISIP